MPASRSSSRTKTSTSRKAASAKGARQIASQGGARAVQERARGRETPAAKQPVGPLAARRHEKGRVLIRAAGPLDREAIAHLRWLSEVQHAASLPEYFRAPPPTARPTPASSAAQPVLVAEQAGAVCGYLVLQLVSTPPDLASTPGPRARIESLVVDRGARRNGVGRRLMAEAARLASAFGANELVLTVWSGNEAAEAFYAALGFEPLALVLRKRLRRS